jgi:hypothetical protein
MFWYCKMQVQWNATIFTIMKLQFLQCKPKKKSMLMLQKWNIHIYILTKQINKHTLTLFQTKSYKHTNVQPNIQTNHKNKKAKKDKQII